MTSRTLLNCQLLGAALLLGLSPAAAQTQDAQASQPTQTQVAWTAANPAALAGTWTVVGPDAALPAAGGQAPTLMLDGRSKLSADTGCNPLSGRYAARGQVMVTSNLAVTGALCDPQSARTETALLDRLNHLTHFSLDGELLTLSSTRGDLLLRRSGPALNLGSEMTPRPATQETDMTPAPQNQSTQHQDDQDQNGQEQSAAQGWTVRSLTVGSQLVPLSQDARFDLTRSADGVQLSGTLGCNRLNTQAQVQNQAQSSQSEEWTFGGVSSTRMACSPEQARAEQALSSVLQGKVQVQASGDLLTLRSSGGEMVLERETPAAATD
ncbi:META domain-containing protein [Deinococcus sp. Marseille-Q6407]|uniref:META domain-containing protein n=1 Tax=Deinococcus sp. Marseille-Q6407 TaxID=2969223 RepID=UPI0021C04963|nr:META domain-containing protein [Deinococcus sp. Marseille-Q6407]